MRPRSRRATTPPSGLLLLSLLVACGWSNVKVRGRDEVFLTVRAAQTLTGERVTERRTPGFVQALELDLAGTEGGATLDHMLGVTDFRAVHGTLAYRAGVASRYFEALGLVGPSLERIEFRNSDSAEVDDTHDYFGVRLGLEVRYHATPWLSPYIRGSFARLEQDTDTNQFEAGVRFHTDVGLGLLLSYQKWYGDYGEAMPLSRDASVNWSGVMLGLSYEF